MKATTIDRAAIAQRIRELGWWYHNIDLDGISTSPSMGDYPLSRWRLLEPFIPADLTGKTVLDLACNSGFFAAKLKQRGAKHVLGIDVPGAIAQAELVSQVWNVDLELRAQNVYEFVLTQREAFDYVLFLGLFYHLRHPLLVLDRLAELTRERLFFQTQVFPAPRPGKKVFEPADDYSIRDPVPFTAPDWPRMAFVEKSFNGDETNWWMPNEACVWGMLRSAGFKAIIPATGPTGDRCYVCEPRPLPPRDDFYFWLSRCAPIGDRTI